MNKENLLLIGLVILVVGGLIYALSGFFNIGTSNTIDTSNIKPSQSDFQTKTNGNEVTIDLTPQEFKDGKLYVGIGVNTHSVDLGQFDLKELTTLEFEGKSIKPSSAPPLSEHHNSGTLIFDVGKELKEFTIKIKGIPDIEERVFKWP